MTGQTKLDYKSKHVEQDLALLDLLAQGLGVPAMFLSVPRDSLTKICV